MATGSPKGRAAEPVGKASRTEDAGEGQRLPFERWELFCLEYVKDRNGLQSAIRAGFAAPGAGVAACRMLKKPNVIARIAELDASIFRRNELEIDALIREAKKLATSDIGSVIERVGDTYQLKPPDKIDTSILSELKLSTMTRTNKDGEVEVTQTFGGKVHSKIAALEMLLSKFGVLKELLRVELSGGKDEKGGDTPIRFTMKMDTGGDD